MQVVTPFAARSALVLRSHAATPVAEEPAVEPQDASFLSRAVPAVRGAAVRALGWGLGSIVGVAGFLGNLAPGAWMGLRYQLGDSSSSEFYTRVDRAQRWQVAKFVQAGLIGAALVGAAVPTAQGLVAGLVVGLVSRTPMHKVTEELGVDYRMNMAIEAGRCGVLSGALTAAVEGWKAGLNGTRAVLSGWLGSSEEQERGTRLLFHDYSFEMSPEGRAEKLRDELRSAELSPGERARVFKAAMKQSERIYESRNQFITREDQRRMTVGAWAEGLKGGWVSQLSETPPEQLLELHHTITQDVDADRAYPCFEGLLKRYSGEEDALDLALSRLPVVARRMEQGEPFEKAILDHDTRALLRLDPGRPAGAVDLCEDTLLVGDNLMPIRND